MKHDTAQNKVDLGVANATGGCCGGGNGPVAEVRAILGRLNETIFEFLSEDEMLKTGQTTVENNTFGVSPWLYIEQICKLAKECLGTKTNKIRKVTLTGAVAGLAEGESPRQNDMMTFKVTVEKQLEGIKSACGDDSKTRLWLVLTNTLSRELHMHEFRQRRNTYEHEVQSVIRSSGPQLWKAFCVSGTGQVWKSTPIPMNCTQM
jgi:hypothetical protein